MTNKEIMETLYINADAAWADFHTGRTKSVNVVYEGKEYEVFDEDKPILDEVQRRLEMSEWHAGTPTDEGCYAVICEGWCRPYNRLAVVYEGVLYSVDDDGDMEAFPYKIIAWHKIEPYKETSE